MCFIGGGEYGDGFLNDKFCAGFRDVKGEFGLVFELCEFEVVDKFVEFFVVARVDVLEAV